jgi:hypothetical protein
MRICILAWGSLIWDSHPEFDEHHDPWKPDGPTLKLEFSRVSRSRRGALTLVIDPHNGAPCQVVYAESNRRDPDDAICDLRCREGTVRRHIGFMFLDGSRSQGGDQETQESIRTWARAKRIDLVVWTDLPPNFEKEVRQAFTLESACTYLQELPPDGKAMASEYVRRAPAFVVTALRTRLQNELWFKQ